MAIKEILSERWWLANTVGWGGGKKLLFISFILTLFFWVFNHLFFHLDWQNYFSQPLCH